MDVEQVCRGIAEQGGATFHDRDLARALRDPETVQTQKDCLDSEEHVRDQLAKAWGSFDSSDRRHCTNESKMGGESSYTELITCLEMARDVRKLHDEAKASHSAEMIGPQWRRIGRLTWFNWPGADGGTELSKRVSIEAPRLHGLTRHIGEDDAPRLAAPVFSVTACQPAAHSVAFPREALELA
jgi:hypothetical protein